MANPRQRRKARSSSHRPVSHSRHAKRNLKKTPPIRGPKALQDAWDSKLTVRQNYARLGLVVNLDPSAAGGVEKPLGAQQHQLAAEESQPIASTSSSTQASASKPSVPAGFGRIIRDASGKVLGVELNEEEENSGHTASIAHEDDVLMDDVESRIDQDARRQWATNFSKSTAPHFGQKNEELVHDLERISAPITGTTTLSIAVSGIGSRHASSGEVKYLTPLVKKHGSNVEAMAGDIKLNPEQRTVGQLRRALKKAGFLT
ncbi:hypothetical protein CPC08DRAFT_703133 [Agrocybe pediades]|nr:hypothetical protein CPC08DRAFT_703133 [Agrocybe pediades]